MNNGGASKYPKPEAPKSPDYELFFFDEAGEIPQDVWERLGSYDELPPRDERKPK